MACALAATPYLVSTLGTAVGSRGFFPWMRQKGAIFQSPPLGRGDIPGTAERTIRQPCSVLQGRESLQRMLNYHIRMFAVFKDQYIVLTAIKLQCILILVQLNGSIHPSTTLSASLSSRPFLRRHLRVAGVDSHLGRFPVSRCC